MTETNAIFKEICIEKKCAWFFRKINFIRTMKKLCQGTVYNVYSSLFRENGYANEIRYPATAAGSHVHKRNVNMLQNQQ